MDTVSVQFKDNMVFWIPLFCAGQMIQPSNMQFYPLKIGKSDQICPIDQIYSWIPYNYYERLISFELDDIVKFYPQYLEVISIHQNTLGNYWKIALRCRKVLEGPFMGHFIKIKKKNERITVHLKKKGCQDDKIRRIQLRIDDILMIYVMNYQ